MPSFVQLGPYIIAPAQICYIILGRSYIQIHFAGTEDPVELRHPSKESTDFLEWMRSQLATRLHLPE